jgi:steroid delta-isomerase
MAPITSTPGRLRRCCSARCRRFESRFDIKTVDQIAGDGYDSLGVEQRTQRVPGEMMSNSEILRNTLDAYFAAIAARDPKRIASVFAEDGEIEDPVGSPVRQGREAIAGLFAVGVAALASHVEIKVLAALPSGDSIAAHWAMAARGKAGREVKAEGIDVLRVDAHGLIVRADGYWNAAAFREALAAN